MIQAMNNVTITGILKEINLAQKEYTRNGVKVQSICGDVTIHVTQPIGQNEVELDIPVHVFTNKYTKAGTINPSYDNMERVMNTFVSMAAAGGVNGADWVSITNGSLSLNEYPSRDGSRMVSFPKVTANFINKAKAGSPQSAKFVVSCYIRSCGKETDKDGIPTGRYKITGVIPGFGDRIDIIDFIAESQDMVDKVSACWQARDTVQLKGNLNFTSKTEMVKQDMGFGEVDEVPRTIQVSECIITGGNPVPLTGVNAYLDSDIEAAIRAHEADNAQKLANARAKGSSSAAPARRGLNDLGF